MKIVYSQLKQLLPQLSLSPKAIGNDLTMIGHFMDSYSEYKNDSVISLEIRQNRGDALSYYGIAKELSVLYHQTLTLPPPAPLKTQNNYNLPIRITTDKDVKRVMAVKISNIRVQPSPLWLRKLLAQHDINAINNVVDLTNYIMLYYGIPCHAFDTAVTSDELIWENNNDKYKDFITLDGSRLNLTPDTLLISNPKKPLSLSFIGGQNSGISNNTTETIIEMAIYNRSRVRSDSRQLKVITEAGIRLDKELDTQLIPQAFNHLINLITQLTGGTVTSNTTDIYIQQPFLPTIPFNPDKPSLFAGIPIPPEFALNTLQSLGCSIEKINDCYKITPPTLRKDLAIEEDLIEEIIRFWGYQKIPLDQPISPSPLPDITPPILYLIESVKNILVNLGYDEVRSWPLIKPGSLITDFIPKTSKPVYTQNSINSEYPVLRASLISSLLEQKDYYDRFKLPRQQFFEVGKIYYRIGDNYHEKYTLAIYHQSKTQLIKDLGSLFKNLKVKIPKHNQFSNNNQDLYIEIDLENLLKTVDLTYLKKQHQFLIQDPKLTTSYELTKQIITLDANVTLSKSQSPHDLLAKYREIINKKYLWQMDIIDIFEDPRKKIFRYTFRVAYYNTDDKTAKSEHLKAFNLT